MLVMNADRLSRLHKQYAIISDSRLFIETSVCVLSTGSTTHDYTVQGQSIARADGHRTRYIAIDSRPTSARTAHVYSPDSPLPIYVDEDDGHQVHAPNNTISQSESVDILTHEHGNGTQISPDMAHHP
eukprot:TRINITY_DN6520_c0_g1_i3.p2 TRINITY_DN6520_c0_g1~~TRINITY_DN6520_c0_g1_i3.p2  ORF type:complete len:128 (+),score=22.71 TRINITY_DN6520_c0_g1_i3:148-531(+)